MSQNQRLGDHIQDFKLLKTLGTGTFGRVYLCSLPLSQTRYFAIKMLKKLQVVRLKQVEHIISERNILATVKHPFIVRLLRTYQDKFHVYMLEEYVPGGEMFSHLRRSGRFTNEICRFYASQITLALSHLHSLDIIYRDLKPENLLLDHSGNVKITDFGFAKIVADRTWTLCGTPEYLAPEIIQAKGHGKAVDWWALGILIFEMLAGHPPFFDEKPFIIYEKILRGHLEIPLHFSVEAEDLVRRLLTHDRHLRIGNLFGGSEDVKKHPWFNGVNWDDVLNCKITPPIRPVHTHAGDSRNFDSYAEIDADEPVETEGIDEIQYLFKGF